MLNMKLGEKHFQFAELVWRYAPLPSCELVNICQRELLRYGCGYSTRETASLLELSFAAAQKLLQRAKAALRQELEKEGLTV